MQEVPRAQGASRSSPGTSRSSPGMTAATFQKIEKLSLRVRLVSPEGRQIAQVGSLARWNRVDSRPSLKDRVLRLRVGPHLGPFRSVRKLLRILLCVLVAPGGIRMRSEEVQEGAGGTREAQGASRSSPGTPRSSPGVTEATFQKIEELSLRVSVLRHPRLPGRVQESAESSRPSSFRKKGFL